MPGYQKMYYFMCSESSKAIDDLEAGNIEKAKDRLCAALQKVEEIYIQTCGPGEAEGAKRCGTDEK